MALISKGHHWVKNGNKKTLSSKDSMPSLGMKENLNPLSTSNSESIIDGMKGSSYYHLSQGEGLFGGLCLGGLGSNIIKEFRYYSIGRSSIIHLDQDKSLREFHQGKKKKTIGVFREIQASK
jgi:hypothetical protein